MSRRILVATKCCQMTNAKAGTGSGGDRCTEACAAIIATTYKIVPSAWSGKTPEGIMYAFTEMLNHGSDTSVPENASWIGDWLSHNANGLVSLTDKQWPSFQDIVDCIDRSHMAIGGFDNYPSLRLVDGSNPYQWTDPPGLGHVLIIVGYDTDKQAVIVHDPLRADPDGQPADYSWSGFQRAVFHDLVEVHGPALALVGGFPVGVPSGWKDDGASLTAPNGVKVSGPFRAFIINQGWDPVDWPLAPSYAASQVEEGNAALGGGQRQDFRLSSLGWLDNPAPPFANMKQSIYRIWLGQDRQALKQQVADLLSQLHTPPIDLAKIKSLIKALASESGSVTHDLQSLVAQLG